MVIVVFRSRLQATVDLAALEKASARMHELAITMPGFVSYKEFTASDEETLTLIEFESEAHLVNWRNHPEHLAVQAEARQSFFSAYEIKVCMPLRSYQYQITNPQHN